jgi:uncharacterized protein YcfL
MLMKKMLILPLVVSALGASLLASCTSTSKVAVQPTGLQKEIVSTALLASNATSSPSALQRAATGEATSSIVFNVNDVNATLSSFDSLALDSYSVKTSTTDSDKTSYAKKDEIVYTLPEGGSETIILYYNEMKEGSLSATAAVSASVSTATSKAESEEEKDEKEKETRLHGLGFRSGAFNDLLGDAMEFDDFEDDANVSVTGSWREGLAYIESVEYRFYSEELNVKEDDETTCLSSFGLFKEGSFLSVEQIDVMDGTEKETAYAYTAFQNASYTRFLLTEDTEDQERRLVYKTPLNKLVINRFVDQGKTLYSLHAKQIGAMSLVGLYERIVTINADGSETITYQLYTKTATIPDED